MEQSAAWCALLMQIWCFDVTQDYLGLIYKVSNYPHAASHGLSMRGGLSLNDVTLYGHNIGLKPPPLKAILSPY